MPLRLLRFLLLAGALAGLPVGAGALERELAPAVGRPLVDVFDLRVLARLEAEGFSLARLLGAGDARSNAALRRASPAYAAIAEAVGADVRALRAEMARNGRPLHEVTDGNVGRVMDLAWLDADVSRFSLIAVVNRLDRRDFAESAAAACGEVRLVYRLRYHFPASARRPERASRLPFNLNAVFELGDDGAECRTIAGAWTPQAPLGGPAEIAAWLRSGILARARLARIEVNAQIVRFPSGMETTFGGQAIYLLRTFAIDGEGAATRARPRRLENTPDVDRMRADAALRASLVDYVREAAPAIDRGAFRLPEALLAERALSFSTFGGVRSGNRPFAAVLREADFAGLELAGSSLVRSPAGLIERLDNTSCAGCHQGNATAGFHIFGFDDETPSPLNRVEQAASPHYYAERARRFAYLEAVAAGRPPNLFRPLSIAPAADWSGAAPRMRPAGVTMACLPQRAAGDLADPWPCEDGSECRVIATNERLGVPVGQCVRRGEDRLFSGHPCLTGVIEAGAAPYLDRFRIAGRFNSPSPRMSRTAYNCRPPHLGVPGGIVYRQCTDAERAMADFRPGAPPPDEICAFVGGRAFDDCVATQDFAACLPRSVVRGNRTTCGGERLCREDYICQALPAEIAGERARGYGFCTPTYFMFQMRIDNHPSPRGG